MRSVAADRQLAVLSARLERQPASRIIEWAVGRFGSRLAVTSSMADAVLIDLASRVAPGIDVLFIDTGFHFPETLEMVERVAARYPVNIEVLGPGAPEALWGVDAERCCALNKVAALDAALTSYSAWMSGLRRQDSPGRSSAPILSRDRRGLTKVNPLAAWSDRDVDAFVATHDVIVNPLLERGYTSIGCAPCTAPAASDDPRSGRWVGSAKTECGLHL